MSKSKKKKNSKKTKAIIRDIYASVAKLETLYPGRHFTPDGHLVGSIGEVYAAEKYGLELFPASTKTHDAQAPDGRLVQIKTTQRTSIGISEKPDYLIVLSITKKGKFKEIYNGPGEPVWNLVQNRNRPKNGQYQVSLSKLKTLNQDISADKRIPVLV